jgi:hypothetical protein
MNRGGLLLSFLALVAFGQTGRAADIIGDARDLSTGEMLYRELHSCDFEKKFCTVDYHDLQGNSFAMKTLSYATSLVAPTVKFVDRRFDLSFSNEQDSPRDEVVDAGFDNLIRLGWNTLEAGEGIDFRFLPVGSKSALGMVVEMDTTAECSEKELCLTASASNWLMGMLVAPIQLKYNREHRQLLSYRGLSNIKSNAGERQSVAIRYRYIGTD